jgi:hypothetical protein
MKSMRYAISEPKIACDTFGVGSRSARILPTTFVSLVYITGLFMSHLIMLSVAVCV